MLRFILFKGPVESLNHSIDEIHIQLRRKGHETCISDVSCFDADKVMGFCQRPVEGVICYDGMSAFDREICDKLGITMINIFMDHPMSFARCMADPPEKYIQFMPDEHHIAYARRFYHIRNAFFLPHMASLSAGISKTECSDRKEIPVLFPGGYRPVNELYRDINERFQGGRANKIALQTLEFLIENPSETLEGAFDLCLKDNGVEMPDDLIATFLDHAKLLDHFIRMYFRGKVVGTVIQSGVPITLLSGGWNMFSPAQAPNVTILPGTNFTGVFPYMEKAMITLNVMPWFKSGTHDRIFNALLHSSCPLTDESTWLLEHLEEDRECAYYSLEELEKLPAKIYEILNSPDLWENIIKNGRKKVMEQYTSERITERILEIFGKCQ